MIPQVSRVPRQDPHPLLKPALGFAIDFYCHGWVAGFVLSQNRLWIRLSNLAVLQGSASESQLMNFAAAIWEQMGSFHGNNHKGTTEKWKPLPPAAFLQVSTGWVRAHRHIHVTGSLWVAIRVVGLKPSHHCELQSSWMGENQQPFPGKLLLSWGIMHHKWELNLLFHRGNIFSLKICTCYSVNLSEFILY